MCTKNLKNSLKTKIVAQILSLIVLMKDKQEKREKLVEIIVMFIKNRRLLT